MGPILTAWKRLQSHGLMPVAGGWLDQSQQYLQAMDVIDDEIAAVRAQQNG